MPIRINLLAESQAEEDQKKRDPVKRSLWIAGFLLFLVLLFSGSLHARLISERFRQNTAERGWKDIEKPVQTVTDTEKKSAAVQRKLDALYRVSTNRFLWGPTLNALQMTTVNDVALQNFTTVQRYEFVAAVAARKADGKQIPAKPATTTESISFAIKANDYSPNFNQNAAYANLESYPYFKTNNLKVQSLPVSPRGVDKAGRAFVTFGLECTFPEVKRDE